MLVSTPPVAAGWWSGCFLRFGLVSAPAHLHLQSIGLETAAVTEAHLRGQVAEVFFEHPEVVEVLAVGYPLGLSYRPIARQGSFRAGLEAAHIAFPAAGNELVCLAWLDVPAALAADVALPGHGVGCRLEIGHDLSSPAHVGGLE
ncbi:hypothetical protein [Pseudomonas sp. RIT623]|uniref:hypothetical protein n=1 Tax=Pseudomonas sp. RIT623 TaxID=2559075 RepID=UPI001430C995|nr:hypothetical protein [Pseudomonas sp. RIT623]